MLPATGALGLPRGARVRIRLGAIDEITLDITGAVVERLDHETNTSAGPDTLVDDAGVDDDEDDSVAGPISIAVDVTDAPEQAQTASENPL